MIWFDLVDYPKITWKPNSPFYAVEEKNDVLEVKTNTDDGVTGIEWFKDGVPITESSHFAFIGLALQTFWIFIDHLDAVKTLIENHFTISNSEHLKTP